MQMDEDPPSNEGTALDCGRRDGFGMELLCRSLPYDLEAETDVDLRSDRLRRGCACRSRKL